MRASLAGRWRVLGRAPFLVAVAVLLLNDHVLKAAFGTWWTGKLSDVAGVVVVTILASVAIDATWAVALTAVGFAALKTVPGVAELAAPVLGGITRRDPTDLVALLVLPLLLRHLHAEKRPSEVPWRQLASAVLATGGSLVAVLAVTATSCSPRTSVVAVEATDQGFRATTNSGFGLRRVSVSEDGRSWSRVQATTGTSSTIDPYGDEPTGPIETCAGTDCFRIVDRRAIEHRIGDGPWLEEERLSDKEFFGISDGCSGRQTGVLRSVAALQRPGGPVAVASLGADGILLRQRDGSWDRRDAAGARPRTGARSGALWPLAAPLVAALVLGVTRRTWGERVAGIATALAGIVVTLGGVTVTLLADSGPRSLLVCTLVGATASCVLAFGAARLVRPKAPA